MYKWPLTTDSFSIIDRLKVCSFVLNKKNKLTMGPQVERLEKKMARMSGSKVLATCSGSAAISLLAASWKEIHAEKFKKTIVVVPACTWASSISCWVQLGYQVKFCDINLNDFCFDYTRLDSILSSNKDKHIIMFPTSLLGWVPDIWLLKRLAERYKTDLFMDCAENMLGSFNYKNIMGSCDNTITSMYWSHHIVGIELGALATKDQQLYNIAKCIRNHGLTRSLNPLDDSEAPLRAFLETNNPSIDPQFLFAYCGTNYRTTDINAKFALLDLARHEDYANKRARLYEYFHYYLSQNKYMRPILDHKLSGSRNVPFALPILTKQPEQLQKVKNYCIENQIEYRPIVGGNLLKSPAFKTYGNYKDFPNAEIINNQGMYVGLSPGLEVDQIIDFANDLNKL